MSRSMIDRVHPRDNHPRGDELPRFARGLTALAGSTTARELCRCDRPKRRVPGRSSPATNLARPGFVRAPWGGCARAIVASERLVTETIGDRDAV
jgi:hypothetical protein